MKATKTRKRWLIAQFAEIRWWRRYLSRQDPHEYRMRKTRFWHNFLAEAHIQVPPDHTVLDVGCGPAGIFMALTEHKAVAVDPLLDAYQKNLSAFFNPALYPHTTFVQGRLEELNLGTFDYVFCLNAINHVDDLQHAMAQLALAMHPNSQLILTVDAHNRRWMQKIFKAVPGDILHPHQYHLDDYIAFLKHHGLELTAPAQRLKHELIFSYYLLKAKKNTR
jgi:2-polyprenyl-6-hydroxyphenyl methylase/3-demethylubiquinone-9 3-methyltransferase